MLQGPGRLVQRLLLWCSFGRLVDGPVGLGRGGAACSVLLAAITNNNNTAAAVEEEAGIRPREFEQPAALCYSAYGMWDCRREVYVCICTRQAGRGVEL
jgi:hypothetical protein